MTIGQAKAIEEDLGKKRQNLDLYQRSLEQELMEEQAKVNEELYTKVTDYLKGYAEGKQLHVVLKYNTGSDLLYGGTTLDITKDVIDGLNELYKQELASTKSKADSTKAKRSNRNSPPTEATDVQRLSWLFALSCFSFNFKS